jgi:hypothetical protein
MIRQHCVSIRILLPFSLIIRGVWWILVPFRDIVSLLHLVSGALHGKHELVCSCERKAFRDHTIYRRRARWRWYVNVDLNGGAREPRAPDERMRPVPCRRPAWRLMGGPAWLLGIISVAETKALLKRNDFFFRKRNGRYISYHIFGRIRFQIRSHA